MDLRKEQNNTIIISGNIGPRYDGYVIKNKMIAEESQNYHFDQICTLVNSQVDIISAFTINYVEEAIGITYTAKNKKIPIVISFTVENNGKLPSGMDLENAINSIDNLTNCYPLYYMINCAHPKHFIQVLSKNINKKWIKRIKGIRPNASNKSHEELNNATELDSGDINELSNYCKIIRKNYKHINIFGGCCGTNEKHIEKICQACLE